jgi:hypothetical protein
MSDETFAVILRRQRALGSYTRVFCAALLSAAFLFLALALNP